MRQVNASKSSKIISEKCIRQEKSHMLATVPDPLILFRRIVSANGPLLKCFELKVVVSWYLQLHRIAN